MKGLSIRQPWAELIATGKKTIEIRVWSTEHRGRLLICSGKQWHPRGVDLHERIGLRGVAVCTVDLVDVRALTRNDARAAGCGRKDLPDEGWAWILANPKRVNAVPVSGQLRLFSVDRSLAIAR